MVRLRVFVAMVMLVLVAPLTFAADMALMTAAGTVVKANSNVLIIRPRNAEGQFEKALTLKIRGTSKTSTVGAQRRAGQVVMVQRDADPKDLQPNQKIAVIFTTTKDENILLAAVVNPGDSK